MSKNLRAALIDELVFYCGSDAPKALDAVLDALADRADETIHPKYNDWVQPTRLEDASVEDLIAVLREDEE